MAKKPKSDSGSDGANLNSQDAANELRSYIERYESLEKDKKAMTDDQKELMDEAKGRGFDTKVMRKVIALRKRNADDVAEEEAVLGLYLDVLGMHFELANPASGAPTGDDDEEDDDAAESMV